MTEAGLNLLDGPAGERSERGGEMSKIVEREVGSLGVVSGEVPDPLPLRQSLDVARSLTADIARSRTASIDPRVDSEAFSVRVERLLGDADLA